MRGLFSSAAVGGLLLCALEFSTAAASSLQQLSALADEKAAAVSLLNQRAAREVGKLAQDRVFVAYLNASTQGQGTRLRTRMAAMFKSSWNKFGLRELALVDRSGLLVVRVGSGASGAPASYDISRVPALAAGFAQARFSTAAVASGSGMTFAAPVVWRENAEFVLTGRQDIIAYRSVLKRGTTGGVSFTLVDAKGRVLADTREASPQSALVGGLSLQALRRTVKGGRDQGAGEVARDGRRFYVSYRRAADWTVVASMPAPVLRRCSHGGGRLCG